LDGVGRLEALGLDTDAGSDGAVAGSATLGSMSQIVHGRVSGGRLHVDEPVDLPEGAQVELVIVDAEDGLDDDDRAQLHAAIDEAEAELERGEGIPVEKVLSEARAALRK
jgi:hypothetical protein